MPSLILAAMVSLRAGRRCVAIRIPEPSATDTTTAFRQMQFVRVYVYGWDATQR